MACSTAIFAMHVRLPGGLQWQRICRQGALLSSVPSSPACAAAALQRRRRSRRSSPSPACPSSTTAPPTASPRRWTRPTWTTSTSAGEHCAALRFADLLILLGLVRLVMAGRVQHGQRLRGPMSTWLRWLSHEAVAGIAAPLCSAWQPQQLPPASSASPDLVPPPCAPLARLQRAPRHLPRRQQGPGHLCVRRPGEHRWHAAVGGTHHTPLCPLAARCLGWLCQRLLCKHSNSQTTIAPPPNVPPADQEGRGTQRGAGGGAAALSTHRQQTPSKAERRGPRAVKAAPNWGA